jgi:hypothetical protein
MQFLMCWRIRRRLTPYVDDVLPYEERRMIERHLDGCQRCRQRVRIEEAVRHGLRARTARAGSTAWLARPDFSPAPALPRRYLAPAALALVAIGALTYWRGAGPGMVRVHAVGVISDSICNGVHHPAEAPDARPSACVQGCIRKGASYVFVARDRTYTVRNQEFADLVASAGRTVEISGTADGTELTLAAVALVQ